MRKFFFLSLIFLSCFILPTSAQKLKPGFDQEEFLELLKIGSRTTVDSAWYGDMEEPQSKLVYQSTPVGFDNLWQLWMRPDGVPVISVRGTTKSEISFLANIYAAMVPAKGKLKLSNDFTFDYNLSEEPHAAVHIGFLMGTAFLSKDIVSKIDSLYKTGIKEFIIAGHSQGGAISYLLTSHLLSLQKSHQLPEDIRFKSCISAAPKPGNLQYAYTFEQRTNGGWAYNVVNSADWVPEVPFSIQTLNDLPELNPFTNAKKMIRKQKFPTNIALKFMYNGLNKSTLKAQKKYQKYLGKTVGKIVKKSFPEFTPPTLAPTNNYVRTGNTIVLIPDSSYYKKYPQEPTNIWMHHSQTKYQYLILRMPPVKK